MGVDTVRAKSTSTLMDGHRVSCRKRPGSLLADVRLKMSRLKVVMVEI